MRTRRARALASLGTGLLAILLVGVLGAPSHAEPPRLLVSDSAAGPFRDQLATPLFDLDGPFVPRQRASATFHVKNTSDQAARATLAVVNRGGTNEFEEALTFDVDIDGTGSSAAVPEVDGDGCSLVTTGPSIAPGASQVVDVSLVVDDLTDRVGTGQVASLDLVLTLTEVGPDGQVEVCGEQATAQPGDTGAQATGSGSGTGTGTGGGSDCDRDVVVTVAGTPTCVPTAVAAGADAGYGGGEPRDTRLVLGLALVTAGTGAGVVGWRSRRRRTAS